jgi:large conductance mechanosensitive channel
MKKFLSDFKDFAIRGNVIDMAVGLVIGSAFTKIVNSLVNDIIMPLVSLATGQISFSQLSIVFSVGQQQVTFAYGNFIQTIVEFIILAFSVFCAVKLISKLRKKWEKKEKEDAAKAPKEPTTQELLTEIRDLMKSQNKN